MGSVYNASQNNFERSNFLRREENEKAHFPVQETSLIDTPTIYTLHIIIGFGIMEAYTYIDTPIKSTLYNRHP